MPTKSMSAKTRKSNPEEHLDRAGYMADHLGIVPSKVMLTSVTDVEEAPGLSSLAVHSQRVTHSCLQVQVVRSNTR